MAGQILIVLFAAVVVGVALVVLGLRGRRLNRNPTCRSCAFDLSGTLPDGVTCPECGAGLKRDRAIRIGQRKRIWVVAVIGAGLIVLPTGGLAVTVYAVLTGAEINQYKPLGMLLWETSRASNPDSAEALAREFSRRRQTQALDEAQTLRVVEAILDLQADPNRPWCEEFGDFIEMTKLDDIVTDELYNRFAQQAMLLEFKTRPRILPGDPLPVVATLVEARVGSGSQFMVTVWLTDLTIDGRAAPKARPHPRADGMFVYGGGQQGSGMIMLMGSATGWGPGVSAAGQTVAMLATVPEDASVGPASVGATLTCRVETVNPRGSWSLTSGSRPPKEGKRVSTRQLTAETSIVLPGAMVIDLIDPTEPMRDDLAQALTPEMIWTDTSGRGLSVNIMFPVGDLPAPVACDVFWRVGEEEWQLGSFTSGSGAGDDMSNGWGYQEPSRQVYGSVGNTSTANAELVLRPNPDLVLNTVDITSIYCGEIVITDLEIQDMGNTSDVGSGSILGALARWLLGG